MIGILFDLDQTLIDSSAALHIRGKGSWNPVYALIKTFKPYDGIADILAMLIEREIPIGIVTTSPRPYCVRVIEHHGFVVSKLVCFHDTPIGQKKPHPAPTTKGIKLLGLEADQVWVIGDDPKDIKSAKAAGAHSIGVTWGSEDHESLRASKPDQLFDTVADLHAFLDELTS